MIIRGTSKTSLVEGDRVSCSISHEIKIDGETSWVKFEIGAAVHQNESDDEAIKRVAVLTNKAVMDAVHTTVETVKGNQ